MHYPKSFKDIHITQGHICDILYGDKEENGKYSYTSFLTNYSSFCGSSGSPVLNYKNSYVIGLHKGGIPRSKEKKNEEETKEENEGQNENKEEKIKMAIIIKKAIKEFIDERSKQNNLNYISPYSYLDTIDIIYYLPLDKKNIIKVFGTQFAERYRNNNACKIIHNGIEYPISEYFQITNDDIQKGYFQIKLKGVNMMTDLSYMFRFVNNLLDVPNISRMDTSNVESMEVMFEKCDKLFELKGINRWNVEKVVSMRGMFFNCFSLKYLPEIDEWNPINLKDCYQMFFGCKSLPNSETSKIEKWKNVNKNIISKAFKGYTFGQNISNIVYGINHPDEALIYWKDKLNKFIK